VIRPESIAGVLLREHDSPQQAHAYAMRKADLLQAVGNAMGLDYARAAAQLAELIEADRTICAHGAPIQQRCDRCGKGVSA
jgi:hypothetical protein